MMEEYKEPEKRPENLSSTLQEILEMELIYSDGAYQSLFERIRDVDETVTSEQRMEFYEDKILKILKKMIQEPFPIRLVYDAFYALKGESMQNSQKRELFQKALKELADNAGYKDIEGLN